MSAFNTIRSVIFLLVIITLSGCSLLFGLFYRDWSHKTAYVSSDSRKEYYVIEGVTQSHCGCSDIIAKGFKNKKLSFTLYYGGGIFHARKYVYMRNSNNVDTLIYALTSSTDFTIAFDSLDNEILRKMDTLIKIKPKGSGLIYDVKKSNYTGYIKIK